MYLERLLLAGRGTDEPTIGRPAVFFFGLEVEGPAVSSSDSSRFRFGAAAAEESHEASEEKISFAEGASYVADGRATESPAGFDPTFAQQAFTLQNPGDFTAAFETPFGVHVIQLEKRLPAERPTDAEVGAALEPELVGRRVRRLQGEALSRLQPLLPVTIAPSAEEDMATWTGRVLAPTEGPASSPP